MPELYFRGRKMNNNEKYINFIIIFGLIGMLFIAINAYFSAENQLSDAIQAGNNAIGIAQEYQALTAKDQNETQEAINGWQACIQENAPQIQ